MAAPTKEYGLFVRNSSKSSVQPKLAIFDDDSDEDGRGAVGKSLQKEANRIQAKKQVKINLETALAEDPTVFEYDAIYDDIAQKKQEQTAWQKRNKEKTPKYIGSLMKAAKSRKLDQERALERKVQKEREAEGEEFSGKDAFVTSAYKKKMQEMEELEEKERREAQIEALTDVTKQKDLSGFYRQLYKHTLGAEEPKESTSGTAQTEKGDSSQEEERGPSSKKEVDDRKPRQFRRRRHTTDSSSENEEIEKPSKPVRQTSSSSDSDSSHEKAGDKNIRNQEKKRGRSSSSNSTPEKVFALENVRRRSRSSASREKSPIHSKSSRSSRSRSDRSDRYRPASTRNSRRSRERRTSDSSEDSKRGNRQRKSGDDPTERRHGHSGSERSHRSRGENSDSKRIKAEIDKVKQDRVKGDKKSDVPTSTEVRKAAEEARREKLVALFKKRHVGDAFEQARERYLARKEAGRAMIATC